MVSPLNTTASITTITTLTTLTTPLSSAPAADLPPG